MARVKVLVTEVHAGEGDRLAEALGSDNEFEVVAYAQDGLDAAQAAHRLHPDIALLWEDLPGVSGLEACEVIARAAPNVAAVLVTRGDAHAMQSRAMMAGARLVVGEHELRTLREQLSELGRQRQNTTQDWMPAVTDPGRAPVVYTVCGGKGGVGKTTIAVNLAVQLARRHGERVVLLEMVGQLGDAAILLDLSPVHGLLSLAELPSVDQEVVRRSTYQHESGISLLPVTSEHPLNEMPLAEAVNVELIGQVLGLLKRQFTAVVVDCAFTAWAMVSYISKRSHVVMCVTTMDDIVALRDASVMLELLTDSGVDKSRIILVANKYRKGAPLGPEDLTRVTAWEDPFLIFEDAKSCIAAVNEGVPLVVRTPTAPAAEAVARLAALAAEKGRQAATTGSTRPGVGTSNAK
jgi:Flp pilus assembly CpaE family ATPase